MGEITSPISVSFIYLPGQNYNGSKHSTFRCFQIFCLTVEIFQFNTLDYILVQILFGMYYCCDAFLVVDSYQNWSGRPSHSRFCIVKKVYLLFHQHEVNWYEWYEWYRHIQSDGIHVEKHADILGNFSFPSGVSTNGAFRLLLRSTGIPPPSGNRVRLEALLTGRTSHSFSDFHYCINRFRDLYFKLIVANSLLSCNKTGRSPGVRCCCTGAGSTDNIFVYGNRERMGFVFQHPIGGLL